MNDLILNLGSDLMVVEMFQDDSFEKLREDLEKSTQKEFEHIDRQRATSLDQARTKYLD